MPIVICYLLLATLLTILSLTGRYNYSYNINSIYISLLFKNVIKERRERKERKERRERK